MNVEATIRVMADGGKWGERTFGVSGIPDPISGCRDMLRLAAARVFFRYAGRPSHVVRCVVTGDDGIAKDVTPIFCDALLAEMTTRINGFINRGPLEMIAWEKDR